MKKILIAGIGNIFQGDDAFGVEVVRQLAAVPLPTEAAAVDFGIRSYDLAYAVAEGHDAIIFVDAATCGREPGTLCLLELDPNDLEAASMAVNGHNLNPVAVLQMARALGAPLGRVFLVGCEPEVLDRADGQLILSDTVAAAVPEAVQMVCTLAEKLLAAPLTWTRGQPGLAETPTERR